MASMNPETPFFQAFLPMYTFTKVRNGAATKFHKVARLPWVASAVASCEVAAFNARNRSRKGGDSIAESL